MDQQNSPRILWRIDLFGGLRAHGAAGTLERFPTQKTGALLAFLAFYRHRMVSREEAADMLWPDAEMAAARDRLSQALVWLRPRLEPKGVARNSVLLTDRRSIGLNPAVLTTDVAQFETALGVAWRAVTPVAQKAALGQAVAQYQGELLPGHYYDWILLERQRLQDAFLRAIHQLIALYEHQGDTTQALHYARRALTVDILHEEAHTDLIRLLAATGQTAAAHRQFQQMTGLLAKELGVEPSAASQALLQQIRQSAAVPQRNGAQIRPDALLTPLTRLFGREAEIARICQMAQSEEVRLVTLTGMGGSGKTRLSLAVAARLAEVYDGAVAFVSLTDMTDAQRIPSAIAEALRLPDSAVGSPQEQVMEALSERPFLLLLDNMEHLLTDAASLIRMLLERTPTLTALVTSRQRLGLEGEREVPVLPLPVPSPEASLEQILSSASTQLFVDRAQSVRPDFAATGENARAIADVCSRLEGIPLAMELCAAWAQTLSPAQMLEKLDRRLDLLVSRRRDIPPRHRTLRAALEYSYLQLPTDLQRLFTRFSVFRGGWSLEAAEAICSETEESDPLSLLSGLTELRERSLVVAEEGKDGEMRYRMLETLREFAAEQLTYAERSSRRRLHATYFRSRAEQAEAGQTGPEQERWLTQLAREQENLRTALAWSLESDAIELGLRLGTALGWYWSMRGPLDEGYQWLRKLLDRTTAVVPAQSNLVPVAVIGKAWRTLGHLAWSQGDYVTARAAHEQALHVRRGSGDVVGITESLYHIGITAYRQEDYSAAQIFFDESLALARTQDDRASIARVLLNLGNIAYEQQRNEEARTLFEQSLAIEQALGNRQRTADTLNNLGLIAIAEKDYLRATDLFEEALTIQNELTNNYGAATVLVNLGTIARLQGRQEHARTLLTDGLKIAYGLGNKHIMIHYLLQMGLLEFAGGYSERSVFLISSAQHLFERMHSSRRIMEAEGYEVALSTTRATLGDKAFETLWSRGQTALLGEIVSLALSLPHDEIDSLL